VRNLNGRLVLNKRDRVDASLGQLERRKTRGTTSRGLAGLTESGDGTSDNTTRLRITDGGLNLGEVWVGRDGL
jgi:hypothetical protein